MGAWWARRNGAACITLLGAALFALDWLFFAQVVVRSNHRLDVEIFRAVLLAATAVFLGGWILLLRSLISSRDGLFIIALGVAVYLYGWCFIIYTEIFGWWGVLIVVGLLLATVSTFLLGIVVTLWRILSWFRNARTSAPTST
jgi:hypothetical protein